MIEVRDGWLYGELPDDTGRLWPVVRYPQLSARGPLGPTPDLCLHTTETDSYIPALKYPSQWQCGQGKIGQHIRLGLAGDAVNDHDQELQQIEMVGRSKLTRWLPDEPTLGPTVALIAWLHATGKIRTGLERPNPDWPVVLDRGPQAVESYYRRSDGTWRRPGVYGHVEVPGNSHYDPGSLDYPALFARVAAVLETEEDDMADPRVDELLEGLKAFNRNEAEPKDGLGLVAYRALKKAATTSTPSGGSQTPGAVPSHRHDVGKTGEPVTP